MRAYSSFAIQIPVGHAELKVSNFATKGDQPGEFDLQMNTELSGAVQWSGRYQPASRNWAVLIHLVGVLLSALMGQSQGLLRHNAIWMSQFLACFSEQEIVTILRRAFQVMTADTTLHILELFWDRQPNETAAFCLQQTSLYFTCIANGNSQMYHSSDLLGCLAKCGLRVVEERDQVGQYHTWLKCRKT